MRPRTAISPTGGPESSTGERGSTSFISTPGDDGFDLAQQVVMGEHDALGVGGGPGGVKDGSGAVRGHRDRLEPGGIARQYTVQVGNDPDGSAQAGAHTGGSSCCICGTV